MLISSKLGSLGASSCDARGGGKIPLAARVRRCDSGAAESRCSAASRKGSLLASALRELPLLVLLLKLVLGRGSGEPEGLLFFDFGEPPRDRFVFFAICISGEGVFQVGVFVVESNGRASENS